MSGYGSKVLASAQGWVQRVVAAMAAWHAAFARACKQNRNHERVEFALPEIDFLNLKFYSLAIFEKKKMKKF